MKTLNEENRQEVYNFLNALETEICITDYLNCEDLEIEDFQNDIFDNICETIRENRGFEQEVIYYSNAIEYLKEHDPSLKESIEIAIEYGFELKNLSSEVLASLLKTENVTNDFYELRNSVNNFFYEMYDKLDEEESDED